MDNYQNYRNIGEYDNIETEEKEFIPSEDCSCIECKKEGYCPACEDFGCPL